MMLLLLFILLIIVYYYYIYKPHQFWKKYDVPHLPGAPILGHMWKFTFGLASLAEIVHYYYNQFPGKRYFGFYQFMTPSLVIKDINLLKQIAIKDFDYFIDRREFTTADVDPLFGKNLFSLQGQVWKNMRSQLNPAFSGSKMRQMYHLMYECAEEFTNHLLEDVETHKDGVKSMEMKDALSRFTSDVIATCAFGLKIDSMKDKNNDFYLHGKEAIEFTPSKSLKFFGFTLSPFLMKLFSLSILDKASTNFFRDVVNSTMKIREEKNIYRPDMIQLLMEAKKGKLKNDEESKSKDTGYATLDETEVEKKWTNTKVKPDWDSDDLVAQAFVFYFAGFETSSTMLCHLTNELAQNVEIQKRLQQEIDKTFESCGGKITYDVLIKMKYLDMVLTESFRKWPVSPMVDRLCVKPYTIYPENKDEKPLRIEKGVDILIPIYGIHRDPNYFPNPDVFDPERFSDERKDEINPFSVLPFGIGPRGCIGSRFSILEGKLLCVLLLHKFDIVVVKETQIPFKFQRFQFNTLSEKGFWIGLKKRQK